MPPVDDRSTPLALRVPVAEGRSLVEIGPLATPAHVVQLAAKTPFRPSEITPTRTFDPSSAHWLRTSAACRIASPSVVTLPMRGRA